MAWIFEIFLNFQNGVLFSEEEGYENYADLFEKLWLKVFLDVAINFIEFLFVEYLGTQRIQKSDIKLSSHEVQMQNIRFFNKFQHMKEYK